MPYYQLKNIYDAQREYIRQRIAQAPIDCPICGAPLDQGQITEDVSGAGSNAAVKSMLRHCPLGHWSWRGGPNPMP